MVLTLSMPMPRSAWAQDGSQTHTQPNQAPGGAVPPRDVLDDAIHAVRMSPDEHIVLDGTLRDPAWQRAPIFDRFFENGPRNGGIPKYKTRFRVLYDNTALYVGVEAL